MSKEYNVNGLLNDTDSGAPQEPTEDEKAAATAQFIQMLTMKIMSEIPPQTCENAVRKELYIEMSDSIKLASVTYLPEGAGPWPVIIHRIPYGPVEFPEHDAVGELFAKRGYVYFTNRCRGTGLSEGRIKAFEQETDDGLEVLDFISAQEWCDGNIGTYGASYMGHTQWSVAATKNPALKTMYIQVYGGHPYENYYRNGMLRQDIWQSWTLMNGGDARHRSDEIAVELNKKAYEIKPPVKIGELLLNDPVEWAQKWFANPEEANEGWQEGFWKQYEDNAKNLQLPILLQCGWFDLFCQSQLDSWRALPSETRQKSLCLIGPWDHFGFTNGVLPYPGQDRYGVMQIKTAFQWFDHFLKGKPLVLPTGGVEAYSIGDDVWKFWKNDFSANDQIELFLGDHSLTESQTEDGKITYRYDPQYPVESLALGLNQGTVISPKAGEREDQGVYSFVTEPLEKDVFLVGGLRVELFVASTAPATAFTVALFDERTDGNSYLVLNDITDIRYEKDRFIEYEPNTVKRIVLETRDASWTFKKGSRIRIDVSSSDYPWYNAHNNTTVVWGLATETAVADNTLYFGRNMPSKVVIPVNPGEVN